MDRIMVLKWNTEIIMVVWHHLNISSTSIEAFCQHMAVLRVHVGQCRIKD